MRPGYPPCSSEEEIDKWTAGKNILIKMIDNKVSFEDLSPDNTGFR
jgi:hypothetical protein